MSQSLINQYKSQFFLKINNWLPLKRRLILTYIFNTFDFIATTLFIAWFGLDIEANPLAREMYSTNTIPIFKFIVVGFGLYILYKAIPKHPKHEWLTWVVFVTYGLLALYHCFLFVQLGIIFFPELGGFI